MSKQIGISLALCLSVLWALAILFRVYNTSWPNKSNFSYIDECPPPKLALLGIFTTDSTPNTARRGLLRQVYRNLQKQLPPESQIDFHFVMGLHAEPDAAPLPSHEQTIEMHLFPHETTLLDTQENMDDGKTYHWFRHAATHLLDTQQTQNGSRHCTRYRYIGKMDDDAVTHLPRLARTLARVSDTDTRSYYVGREHHEADFMIGMMYFLSENLVRYVATSERVAGNIVGFEDRKVGEWVRSSGMLVERVRLQRELHDYMSFWAFPSFITNETICLHGLKQQPGALLDLVQSDNTSYRDALIAFSHDRVGISLTDGQVDEISGFLLDQNNLGKFYDAPKLEEHLRKNYQIN
ncbi:hypothetical protein BC830DRAFT_469159 [Chytriomyces sp. MP71]|nr:hypothetical protein BC830DRAFT_469159 [Chytriomyces sp. MP71]